MSSATEARTRIPVPVQLARALLAAVAVSHLVVPIVMWAGQAALRDQIASRHPEFDPPILDRSAGIAVTSGAVFHGILLLVCVLLAWKLATGRPWTRRAAIASQLLSVVFGVFSWSSTPIFHAVIPIAGATQILVVALLWIPQPSRGFFSRPGSRR